MPRPGRCVAALVSLWCGGAYGASLDPPAHGYGISFGNSHVFHGLRLNLIDRDVERVVGLNASLWKPGENSDARIDGLMLGLVHHDARRRHRWPGGGR